MAAAAAASSYFADIRKFMGQVTADSLAAQYHQPQHQHQSDEELSSQDDSERATAAPSREPVHLQMAS